MDLEHFIHWLHLEPTHLEREVNGFLVEFHGGVNMHARSSLQGVDGAVMRIVQYSECMVEHSECMVSIVSAW
jgi:hypothetical protein